MVGFQRHVVRRQEVSEVLVGAREQQVVGFCLRRQDVVHPRLFWKEREEESH